MSDPTNTEIAAALDELGDLTELDGAAIYRTNAYRNAAKAVRSAESAWGALNASRSRTAVLQVFADRFAFERLRDAGASLEADPSLDPAEARAWIREAEALLRRGEVHRLTWARLDLAPPASAELEGIDREAFQAALLEYLDRLDGFGKDEGGMMARVRARLR